MRASPQQERLFELPDGACCGACLLNGICGSLKTDNVCLPRFDPLTIAGPNLLHPMRMDFEAHFDVVGGAQFDDVTARPWKRVPLTAHIPQVRALPRLRREQIARSPVGVRLDEMFVAGRVRPAAHLREAAGLSEETAVVLMAFGPDDLLERFWAARLSAFDEVADGGYDLVLPPSYSLWEPRRRPDNLLSLRRSHLAYGWLQDRGVSVLPRVGWVELVDVERWAWWVNGNPVVDAVCLDLMTYQGPHFDRQIALLAKFDKLTGERLHFFVNGVRSLRRILALYLAATPDRVTVSSATLVPPPPLTVFEPGLSRGSFQNRVAELDAVCVEASLLAVSAVPGEDVDGVLTRIRPHDERLEQRQRAA